VKTLRLATCLALLALAACGDDATSGADAGDDDDDAGGGADAGGDGGNPACDPTADGTICTFAGSEYGYSGDDGPAREAEMSLPVDTLRAADGTLYILDWNNHRIRKVDPDGIMRHVAGRGELGGTLDDPANSDFNHPTGLLLTPEGDSLIIAAWHNSKIRTIDLATGDITDTCGDGRRAYFGDEGPGGTASLDLPTSIAFDPDGNLVIMDQANQVIRMVDAGGVIHRIAGRCVVDQMVACAADQEPVACPGGSGKWTCGEAVECAKPCNPGYSAGDSVLTMRMSQPFGQSADPGGKIVYDAAGNLYFADTANHLIRRIATDGAVEVVAGVEPVDGVPQSGTSPDGTVATEALLYRPTDLAIASDGTLYFSDVYNHCVRRIDSDGKVYTVAGICGEKGYDGDGGAPTDAHLKLPYGIELSGKRLFIADTGNHVIRVANLE
jgi:sugar lactone lactonase YvrE